MNNKGLLILLCCISGIICLAAPKIGACVLIGTAIYIWFNMANPKETDKKDEEEDDEDFEDPIAKMYEREVEGMFKPGFEKDPNWQKMAKKVKITVEENKKKEEQAEKDAWKDESDLKMDKRIKGDERWWESYI